MEISSNGNFQNGENYNVVKNLQFLSLFQEIWQRIRNTVAKLKEFAYG